jgi:hypothetical protein
MRNPIRPARSFGWGAAFAASVAILSAVVVRDHPHLQAREEAFAKTLGGHYQPRFWAQGIINLGERNVLVLDASSSAR